MTKVPRKFNGKRIVLLSSGAGKPDYADRKRMKLDPYLTP